MIPTEEELKTATYATLRAHPISEQAKVLVSTLAGMLDDHTLATGVAPSLLYDEVRGVRVPEQISAKATNGKPVST